MVSEKASENHVQELVLVMMILRVHWSVIGNCNWGLVEINNRGADVIGNKFDLWPRTIMTRRKRTRTTRGVPGRWSAMLGADQP